MRTNQCFPVQVLLLLFGFNLIESSPQSQRTPISVSFVHFTACLLNSNPEQQDSIPSYVQNAIVLSDALGKKYHILLFATTEAEIASGLKLQEFCHATMVENNGPLSDVLPEAKQLQSSKCYSSVPLPGYDQLSIERATFPGGFRTLVNDSQIYSQSFIPLTPFNPEVRRTKVHLDTFHLHHTEAGYGYVMRVTNPTDTSVIVKAVSISISHPFNGLFGTNLDASEVHSCLSFQSEATIPKTLVLGYYDLNATTTDFLSSVKRNSLEQALDTSSPGNLNLEDTVYEALSSYIGAWATGFELPWMPKFRTVTAVLDILYVVLMVAQKATNRGKYPSERFDDSRSVLCVHILSGMVIIYTGVYLHFDNAQNRVSWEVDSGRQTLYYVMGGIVILHALTSYYMIPRVMGEKRITIPLYASAVTINMLNGVRLVGEPSLRNAFVAWASVNVFIYQRAFTVLLSFAYIDWELLYTYSILASAALVYPLTGQRLNVFYSFLAAVLYAPFHESVCKHPLGKFLGCTLEDEMGGNKPSPKNLSEATILLRMRGKAPKGNFEATQHEIDSDSSLQAPVDGCEEWEVDSEQSMSQDLEAHA